MVAVLRPAITLRELPTALLDERETGKGLALRLRMATFGPIIQAQPGQPTFPTCGSGVIVWRCGKMFYTLKNKGRSVVADLKEKRRLAIEHYRATH